MKESGINLVQLGQLQNQSAGYLCYRSKKLRSQQDGRMKKHLHNFLTGQFKSIFKLFITMKIAGFYMYMYVYGVIYTGSICMMLIMQQTMLIRLRKILNS